MGVKSYEDLCVFDVNFIEIVPLQDRSLSSAEVCAGSVVWPLSDKSFCLYIYCQLLDVLKSFSGFETAPKRSVFVTSQDGGLHRKDNLYTVLSNAFCFLKLANTLMSYQSQTEAGNTAKQLYMQLLLKQDTTMSLLRLKK